MWTNSAVSEQEGALSLFIYLPGREKDGRGRKQKEGEDEERGKSERNTGRVVTKH